MTVAPHQVVILKQSQKRYIEFMTVCEAGLQVAAIQRNAWASLQLKGLHT